MRLCLPISYVFVGGIRHFIVQIPRIYATLMGYWVAGQVRTTMRSKYPIVIWGQEKISLGGSSWLHVRYSWGTTWGVLGSLLWLVVVEVDLMALGMHFDSFGSLYEPVSGLLVFLNFFVELVKEGLDIALILDGYKASLEVLGEGRLCVSISLAWWLSASSAAWWGSGLLPMVFWIVSEPLSSSRLVFLAPPLLFSVLFFL